MRNYVFIKNKDALDIVEQAFEGASPTTVEFSQNRKGNVITFSNSYWVHRLRDYVEAERNEIAFDLAVVGMSKQDKENATKLVRSLDRITGELAKMSHEFRVRGDYQTT